MQVTVKENTNLNVRAGQPSLNAPIVKTLDPGTTIDVDDDLHTGDSYEGTNTWLKDAAGNYYWSGGVTGDGSQLQQIISTQASSVALFSETADITNLPVNWNNRIIKLSQDIKNNLGNGIKIGVLDSGVEKSHIDLAKCIVDSVDFTNAVVKDLDVQGHGTEMCSLIAASEFLKGKGITGVAPSAKIFSAKVIYDENDPEDLLSIKAGLKHVLDNQVDIINMSIGTTPTPALAGVMKEISDQISNASKTIIFASTKENDDVTNVADLLKLFPADDLNVIPVCALTKEFIINQWDNLPQQLVIMPVFDAICCSIKYRKYYFHDSGSSIATALISGITALILTNNSAITRDRKSILKELAKYSSTIEEAFSNPGQEVHLIIKN